MHFLKLECILMMLSTDKFCFWQAATDWHRACTGSVQFTVLYCVIMNEVVRRETPSIEGKRGIALQLYSRGSVILCFKVQTNGDMYYFEDVPNDILIYFYAYSEFTLSFHVLTNSKQTSWPLGLGFQMRNLSCRRQYKVTKEHVLNFVTLIKSEQ